jgi:uncharacterized membrane protein
MEFLYDALVVLHFIGLASLLGGFLVQLRSTPRVVNPAMLHGALTQLVTGVAMVGLRESGAVELPWELDMTKITIKLVILLVITGLVWANRKKESVPTGVWAAIGGLTIAEVVIAVFV